MIDEAVFNPVEFWPENLIVHPRIIGIDGVDGSGKTESSTRLASLINADCDKYGFFAICISPVNLPEEDSSLWCFDPDGYEMAAATLVEAEKVGDERSIQNAFLEITRLNMQNVGKILVYPDNVVILDSTVFRNLAFSAATTPELTRNALNLFKAGEITNLFPGTLFWLDTETEILARRLHKRKKIRPGKSYDPVDLDAIENRRNGYEVLYNVVQSDFAPDRMHVVHIDTSIHGIAETTYYMMNEIQSHRIRGK